MPIISTDLKIRYSGGAGNSSQAASLGGVKSSTEITDNSLNNIFSDSGGSESLAGSTKYRCVYIHNAHGTLTADNAKVYIGTNSSSTDTTWEIGVGTAAINGTEQTIADEDTAPSGVTFSSPTTYAAGLALGNIPAGQHKAVWYKRITTGPAAADNNDQTSIKYDCDTGA